jgi:hypothetical protein
MDASRLSWCLIVEHLYEFSWKSYKESGKIVPNIKTALEEVIKSDCVAEMLCDLNTEEPLIVQLHKQVCKKS